MQSTNFIPILLRVILVTVMWMTTLELTAQSFSNPISDLADPHITFYNNYYYLTGTTGSNITIKKASTLNSLKFVPGIVVFTPPSGGPCCNFWAPELHRINNSWYIYYTAGTSADLVSQRTWVIENTSADPTEGSWIDKGQIYHAGENFWAIDGSVFQLGDKQYFLWSGHSNASNTVQNIYIAEMRSPLTLTGPRVMLSNPEYVWERNGEINEGPAVVHKNGKVFLVYSASGCWTDEYALGMLTMNGSDNPLDKSSWTKSAQPVFLKDVGVLAFGPGHNGFFLSPDGTEIWNTYHATTIEGGACDFTRTTRAQRVDWSVDGTPQFGSPVRTGELLLAPRGETERPISDTLNNKICTFVSKASGKVLDVAECSADLGADVTQSSWLGKYCQQWNVQATDDGYHVITSARGGLALDVAGCSNDNYANVQTWAPNGAFCQQWKIEDVGAGYFRLLARNSGKALTVVLNSTDEGANVLQQDWTGVDGQQWRIEVAEEVITNIEQYPGDQFSVFPNPVESTLTVSGSKAINEVTLLNVLSQVVHHEIVLEKHQPWTLDTINIPSGLYLLHIISGQEKFITKIVIEK